MVKKDECAHRINCLALLKMDTISQDKCGNLEFLIRTIQFEIRLCVYFRPLVFSFYVKVKTHEINQSFSYVSESASFWAMTSSLSRKSQF